MTKKDYELIAQAIKDAKMLVINLNAHELTDKFRAGILQTQFNLSNAFAKENPRFNKVKFDVACSYKIAG